MIDKSIIVDLIFSELSEEEQAQFLEILNYNPKFPEKSTASIHFEWSWNNETNDRGYYRRWGAKGQIQKHRSQRIYYKCSQ